MVTASTAIASLDLVNVIVTGCSPVWVIVGFFPQPRRHALGLFDGCGVMPAVSHPNAKMGTHPREGRRIVTVQGRKDLAQITAIQDDVRKSAGKSRAAATATSGHTTPRLKQALVKKAQSESRLVATLEKKRLKAEDDARKPDRGWVRPRRSAPGALGNGY
jgi:hypothetical protein